MAKKRRLVLFKGDKALWIIVAGLFLVSLLVVYSATASMAYREVGGNTSYYLFRQARMVLAGFFMILVIHRIDYKYYARYAKGLFKLSVVLVVLAYIIGVSLNDASRWIKIPGLGLTFQPSELLKMSLVILLAQQLGIRQGHIARIPILPSLTMAGWRRDPQRNFNIWYKTTRPLLMPVIIAVLVVLPSNFSTAGIIFLTCMIMMMIGRVRQRELNRLFAVGALAMVLIVGGMTIAGVGRAQTWVNRVVHFVQPDEEGEGVRGQDRYQVEQAEIAIASGGFAGKGPGNSTQRSQLPHPYSDFAYAFIIEEYGVVGGVVVFVLYLWIFYRAGLIVRRCNRPSQGLMVLGLSLIITMQAFVNMAVSVGLMPVTGQPLPLISMGGSSVFFTCISIGLILGVSRETERDQLLAQKAALAEAAQSAEPVTEAAETVPAAEPAVSRPAASVTEEEAKKPAPRKRTVRNTEQTESEITLIDRSREADWERRSDGDFREVVDLWEESADE